MLSDNTCRNFHIDMLNNLGNILLKRIIVPVKISMKYREDIISHSCDIKIIVRYYSFKQFLPINEMDK